MIVVTGATGNIGRALALDLLARGKRVRGVARRSEGMADLRERGAESHRADLGDADQLSQALEGAEAVFAMIPPNLTTDDLRGFQERVAGALVEAIRRSGVGHVVFLSSVGAHLPDRVGPVNGLHSAEQKLSALAGVNLLALRPAFFMENLQTGLELMKSRGIHGTPLRADLALPMIATRDIAAVAAERLARLDFQGKSTRELLGQRDLTMTEATTVLGRAIGKPLRYEPFSYGDAEGAMVAAGVSRDLARLYVELYRSANEGIFKPAEKRSRENTTATSIEQFAEQVFAPAYRAGA